MLRLGYCCINTELKEEGIFCSRTCRLNTIDKKGFEYVYELIDKNLKDLKKIIEWNYKNKIYVYRMSSEMFPFVSHKRFCDNFDYDRFLPELKEIGELARKCNQRLTFHPGQFNQLTSLREEVVENTIRDLEAHCKIMEMMNLDKNGVIVLHGGTKKNGLEETYKRFDIAFDRLSKECKSRLVLENCEMSFSVKELLPICEKHKIPLVFDFHHHALYNNNEDISRLIADILKTWDIRDIIPLFHISESRPEVMPTDSLVKRRAHSDYVENIPSVLLYEYGKREIHIDIEAKMKEKAVEKLYKKYNKLI